MDQTPLFISSNGKPITASILLSTLRSAKADECDILYIHSDLSFGAPNPGLKRSELLARLMDTIGQLGVKTIMFPTFTFSFCNNEIFDRENTRSRMGALTEYARKLPQAVRSSDPLMSSVAIGSNLDPVKNIGTASIGIGSTFDILHNTPNVRFLFFGVRLYLCFTYTHYVEAQLGMPYRYPRDFSGTLIENGQARTETFSLFVRYQGVEPTQTDYFEEYVLGKNLAQKIACGDGWITTIREEDGFSAAVDCLSANPDCLLAHPYNPSNKDTTFIPHSMVAL